MANNKGRRGHAWRKLAAQVKTEETHCWLCGQYVEPWRRYPDPMSGTADHVVELDQAPHRLLDRTNLRLAHFRCNSSRGATYGNHKRAGGPTPARQSREW